MPRSERCAGFHPFFQEADPGCVLALQLGGSWTKVAKILANADGDLKHAVEYIAKIKAERDEAREAARELAEKLMSFKNDPHYWLHQNNRWRWLKETK